MKNHAAFIIHDGAKILFIKRSMQKSTLPGAWSFPIGTQEDGEDIETTATRESEEELGVHTTVDRVLGERDLEEFDVRLHFVLCSIQSGVPQVVDETEISEFAWMTFPEFFAQYSDDEIGHGLVYLRQHPELWRDIT